MQKPSTVLVRILCIAVACASQALVAQSVFVHARIADADIINAGSLFDPMADRVKDLSASAFSLTFVNATSPKQDVLATMHLEAYASLDADRVRMLLYTMDSRQPFLIPKEGRVFTSGDSRGSGDMQFTSVSSEANIQKLKDKIWDPAGGGRVPSGRYELTITLTVVRVGTHDVNEQVPVSIPPVIVSNPTVAALILPSENGYQYPTPFPQFQWTYDTRGVRLMVFEKRPDQSIEDAAQASDPYLEVHIDRENSRGLSIFTYPQSNAALPGTEIRQGPRPLEPGKTYVLALEGVREAFGTTVDPLRTVRSFTIGDARTRASLQSYQSIFSGPEYERIVDLLRNRGFQIDANGITRNSAAISLRQLQTFLNQNRQRKFSVSIEE